MESEELYPFKLEVGSVEGLLELVGKDLGAAYVFWVGDRESLTVDVLEGIKFNVYVECQDLSEVDVDRYPTNVYFVGVLKDLGFEEFERVYTLAGTGRTVYRNISGVPMMLLGGIRLVDIGLPVVGEGDYEWVSGLTESQVELIKGKFYKKVERISPERVGRIPMSRSGKVEEGEGV